MAYNRDNYLQAIARMLSGSPIAGLGQAMGANYGGILANEAAIAGARQAMEQAMIPTFGGGLSAAAENAFSSPVASYIKAKPRGITPAMAAQIIGNRAYAPSNQPSGLNLSNRGYPSTFGAPTMTVKRGR